MVYTSRIRGNADRRPKAFWGALIPAAINFVGGLITSSQQAKAQKRALEEQQRLAQQQLQVSNQNNLATTLNNYASANNSYSDEDYNLKYRNGGTRRLGSNGITITDGGNARRIGNNTFLLRGGSHEDINETGQTGIGINIGGNEIEAEGGEVAQKKNKSLRIFSAQPMLSGGLSPAQAILRGYNKDEVFAAQQRFKRNNNLNDDGSKQRNGGLTSKDRGSSKHPYPSVASKDFAGGNRSYPIPTKADAIDALRLAGLHGRSDVRSKVYSKYPELRKKAKFGDWFTSLFNNNTAAPKKTVHFYKSKSGRVFKNYNEALYDNKLWNNDIVYRYNRKGDLYHKKYGLREHSIPFQKQNAITLRNAGRASGAVISPNQLDSIAKYANRAGLSIPTAFGMVMKESTFNNPTDTKSAAKLFGLKKGTREYNKWTTGQHFQGNGSRLDKGNARDFINFHKDDSLNPYWQDMRYVENQTRDMNKARKMLINGERNADRKAKYAPKLTGGKKLNVMEAAFKDYKINPYGYNPQQKDYVKLINQNARDIMNSPQIQQWYRTSPYAKGRKYKCGGRIKARGGLTTSYRTIPDGGIPGTDSYSSRMRSSYNASPLALLNILGYADQAVGFTDENGNTRYITGIAPAFGIPNKAQIIRNVQQANKLAQVAKASQAAERTAYAAKQAKDFYKGLGINIPVGRNQIYNPTFRSSKIARYIEDHNNSLRMSLNNTHLPKGIRLTPINQKDISRSAARIINPREAEIVRMSIPITQSAKNMTNGANPFLYTSRSSNKVSESLSRVIANAKQGAKSAGQRVGNKLTSSSTYRNPTFAERVRDANGKLIWKQNYKYKPWVKATAGAAGTAGIIGLGIGLSNTNSNSKNIKAQLDAKGQPISPYIARPQEPAKIQTKQVPASIARKDTTRTDTTKQVNKVVSRQFRTTPQYKGNTTRGNYRLHDGETKVINGVKYTRRGNTIINHKTNVGYIYDKNGNYTGQADYSKVGKNFNQAFDAARAAGRNQFIYRAGKYNNYSTVKETNAKKEALNRRIGARRIAKKMGGLTNPPVGSRKKYLPGGTANPWDEYKLPDYGGTAPWQVSNKYAVNVPYPIGKYDLPITTITAKKDTFNDEMSRRMRAGVQNLKDSSDNTTVPYLGKQSSFSPKVQDYIGLGVDTLAALGSGIFTRSAYNKMNFDYALPNYVDESPVAFDTTYHNEAQRANVERNRLNTRGLITGNTSSAQTALNLMQKTDTDAMMETNKLLDEKSNKEVELRNQNLANEQQVRARNAAARNQYYQNVAQIRNAALEAKNNMELAKAQSIGTDLSGLSQAYSNFANSVENRYNTRQNEAIIAATAKDPAVLSNAVQFGYNFSPEVLAAIYNSTNDDALKNLALSQLNSKNRRKYGIK